METRKAKAQWAHWQSTICRDGRCMAVVVSLIILIMKNFNGHGHHGSKRSKLVQHALTWIARIHSHTYINTVTTTWCEAPAQLLQKFGIDFYFEGTWGRGSKPEYPEKKQLVSHIRGENPTSRLGIEPSPSYIGDKLAWPRVRARYDPLSYRPPHSELQTAAHLVQRTCNGHLSTSFLKGIIKCIK